MSPDEQALEDLLARNRRLLQQLSVIEPTVRALESAGDNPKHLRRLKAGVKEINARLKANARQERILRRKIARG